MGLVAAVGTAVTALASTVGVAVTATALTVGFETIAAVGVGLSAIGAVTHDKALSYVGAGLGLVGGIGALAAGAGVLGADATSGIGGATNPFAATAADAATGAASDATTAATTATSGDVVDSLAGNSGLQTLSDANPLTGAADLAGEPAAASGAAAALTPPPGDGTFVGAATTQDAPTAGAATANAPTGQVVPSADAAVTTAPTPNLSMPPTGVTPAAGGVNAAPPGQSAALTNTLEGPGITGSGAGGIIGDNSGTLGSILNYVQKNPLLAFGAVQAGGQLLSGLTSTLTPAQVGALNAQAAANQAAANLTTQQTANLAQPRSTASLAPVTGTPNNIITPPTAGIINGAPPVNVTGTPT